MERDRSDTFIYYKGLDLQLMLDKSLLVYLLLISLSLLFPFIQLLRKVVRKQIEDQMKEMIPIKAIRNRIGLKIKWRK